MTLVTALVPCVLYFNEWKKKRERKEELEIARLLEQPAQPDSTAPQPSKTAHPRTQPYDKDALAELQFKSMFMENIPYHAERLDDYMYAGGDGRVQRQQGIDKSDVVATLSLMALWLILYSLFKLFAKFYFV